MRILIVTTGLAIGGAEMQVVALTRKYVELGHTVEIASLLPPLEFVQELNDLGVKIYDLKMVRKIPDPRAVLKLAKIYREFRPDVVTGHMIHANILSRVARIFVKVPRLISTVHSSNEGGKARMLMYRLTDRWCDMTTCICQPAYDRMLRDKASRPGATQLVYNALKTADYQFSQSDRETIRAKLGIGNRFVWLAVGRLAHVKNYASLINAFKVHLNAFPHSVLVMAGDGDERGNLETLSQSLGITDHVQFLGMRKDTRELYCAGDALAMTSFFEGLSISLLETASVGLPILATKVGGNPEVLGDAYPEELQPDPLDVGTIAKAMSYMQGLSEEQRRSLSEGLKNRVVNTFDIEAIGTQWINLFRG
jgi:glycosyltransferase involved in cell wall biosynthesis